MQERHPIDERFKALYDAEATPPEAVHRALAERLGWSNPIRGGGAWRPLLIAAVGLVIVCAAYWTLTSTASTTRTENMSVAQVRTPHTNTSIPAAGTALGEVSDPPMTSTESDGVFEHAMAPATQSQRPEATPTTRSGPDPQKSSTLSTVNRAANGTKGAGRTHAVMANGGLLDRTPAAVLSAGDGASAKLNDPLEDKEVTSTRTPTTTVADAPMSNTGSLQSNTSNDLFATWIDAIQTIPGATPEAGQPIQPLPTTGYVLPAGTWWIGPYAGVGVVSGQWKGEDTEALQQAEKWHSTAQLGVLAGREWRNGWGVTGGLGLASVRSTFHHETAGEPRIVTDIDTAWSLSVFASTGDILYTWTIDSLEGSVPGDLMRAEASNQYTAIQVPLQVQWHGDVRRMRYGAFGGITAWIPTQREGLTLMRSQPDAAATTLALQDARVDDRFSTQVHGQIGLSLGYSISEYLSAYVEPMVSTPLFSFDGGSTPWLTRPVLQLRLQHEFRSKPR